jgi:replicative DNA helicase
VNRLDEDILQACFERYEGVFKGGERANNKLDLEKLEKKKEVRDRVVTSLGRIVMEYDPAFVVAVPSGADWLARRIVKHHNLDLVQLRKRPRTGKVDFFDSAARQICRQNSRGVIIEDVFNKFTSTRLVMDMPMIEERAEAVVAVWDRGNILERQPLEIPTRALITRHIPAVLPDDDATWGFAT